MRSMYELLNARDVDGFGDALADDFVDHEELPGLEPTKEGVKRSAGRGARIDPATPRR